MISESSFSTAGFTILADMHFVSFNLNLHGNIPEWILASSTKRRAVQKQNSAIPWHTQDLSND